MHIGFFVWGFPSKATFVQNQINGLQNRGHKVTVVARENPKEADEDHYLDRAEPDDLVYVDNIKTYFDGIRTLGTALLDMTYNNPRSLPHAISLLSEGTSAPRMISNLNTVLKCSKFDICHAHFGNIGEYYHRAIEYLDVPFVVTFYGYDATMLLDEDPSRFDKLFQSVNQVAVLSDDMGDKLVARGCPDRRITKQKLAIDVSDFNFSPPRQAVDDFRLLTVARLVPKKGIKYAIEATADLKYDYKIRYEIVGDGPIRDELEALTESMCVSSEVKFLGWKDNQGVRDAMQRSDVFILPSTTDESGDAEGTPTVLLEAQATGLPVVSTKHAGIPEIVADGESGILIPERDVDELRNAIESLLSHPERWAEMGRTGRELVKSEHSIPVMASRLEELYTAVAE